jgi:hypothetical protein
MTVYADAAQARYDAAESEPWYVVAKHAASEECGHTPLTEKRIEFHYTTLPAVQAAIRDLIKTRPYLLPARHHGESVPGISAGMARLEPVLRPMVKALLADGESIRAVIFAPPGGTMQRRKQRPVSGKEDAMARTWRGVAVTDRRVLMLELPAPAAPGGLRYESIVTQMAPDAIHDLTVLPAQGGAHDLQVRVQRGGAEQVWHIELDERLAGRWTDGVSWLEGLVRAAKLPIHTEYRRFVAATGLQDVVLTNPAHYAILLKQIKEHRYYLGEHGRTVDTHEAAEDWYRSLYGPITMQLTARGTTYGTPADMYMRLCEYKWLASERLGADIGFDLALQAFQYWVA